MSIGPSSIRKFLAAIASIQIERDSVTIGGLAKHLVLRLEESRDIVSSLAGMGLLKRRASKVYLTPAGRNRLRVVMTGGVFDLVHVGHIATLEAAKRLGDILVVVVARDLYVQSTKGREPVNDEMARLRVVRSLKPVDAAVLGNVDDIYKVVEEIRPDVIALGYDQKHREQEVSEELRRRGLPTHVTRLKVRIAGAKTSNILSHIGSRSLPQESSEDRTRQ